MRKLFALLVTGVLVDGTSMYAQTCGCLYQRILRAAGYYGPNDFNSYQYLRATFDYEGYSTYISPYNNTIQYDHYAGMISESNDPGVEIYPSSGQLISTFDLGAFSAQEFVPHQEGIHVAVTKAQD